MATAWTAITILLCSSYLVLVRVLRYRLSKKLRSTVLQWKRDGIEITPFMAQQIALGPVLYDMPVLSRLGASVALLKTYGIPDIAKLLLHTGEMSTPSHLGKRVIDTGILLSTMTMTPLQGPGSGAPDNIGDTTPVDPRGSIALARVNWLHGRYKIPNDHMIYTLSLFALEPVRLVNKYGWRRYSDEETECVFIMWKELGRRMDIKDIPETVQELQSWSEEYERLHMVPSQSSHNLAVASLEYLSQRVPNIPGLRSLVQRIFIGSLDDPLREAMMLPKQPHWIELVLKLVFGTHSTVVKYLCLPRRRPGALISLDNPPSSVDSEGKLRVFSLIRFPWYYPAPTGIRAALDRFLIQMGLMKPENYPGPAYKSEGYRLEELGPLRLENNGHPEVFQNAEAMLDAKIGPPWGL